MTEYIEARHTLDCDMVKHPNCTRCNCGSSIDPNYREAGGQSPQASAPAIGVSAGPAAPGSSKEEIYRRALTRIAKWFGEFPPTGRSWEDGSPMSYSACWGSNGERDYMRNVAIEALAEAQHQPSAHEENV